jgi:AraC-like DNA-binding protein
MSRHFYKVSLAAQPEIRTNGSFGDDSETLNWVQPQDLWQALLLHHPGTFSVNGYSFSIHPFDLVIVPPGSRCEIVRSGSDTYVYDYFTFVPVESEADVVALPLHTNLGEEGRFWDLNFRRGLQRLQLSRTSARAVAYSMLWAVAQPVSSAFQNVFVEAAEKLIESRLHEPLKISEIAAELGVSQSQLGRLFMAEHGRSLKSYQREQRAKLAHRLLSQSTMPIKQVAASCGIGNVHTFNRFVREWFGVSPRTVRAARGNLDVYRVGMYTSAFGQQKSSR